ncbi:hydrogenase expression protein HypA [Streptomyces sp. RG38]|uniref:Hydrogenase expression protein HypA n=1 Tax=Streptomyces tagetis TaxID=2820809 RepID=A0A940XFS0_9ACTN|nr:hydrogenase expression protein HypA [Streptomyces sp. RG38]
MAGAEVAGAEVVGEVERRPTAPYSLRKADFDERDDEDREGHELEEHDERAAVDEADEDLTDQGDEAPDAPDAPAGPEASEASETDPASYRLPEPQGTPGPRPARPTPSAPAPGRLSKAERRNRPRQSDDEYEGPGLLNRPLVVGPAALIVAALVVIPLVVLGSGGSDDGGHQSKAARATTEPVPSPPAGSSPTPTVSVSAGTAPPSPSQSQSPSPSPSKSEAKPNPKHEPKPEPAPATTVTVTAEPPRVTTTVTAKPKPATAATEVNRLAKNDPGGRHICYRAYVDGQGWQKPVCDGTLAGTTGKGKSIKALNISVHGTGGSAANAVLHNPDSTDGNGSWQPSWTAITQDGKDFYIGNPKKDGPYMTGFAINIGSGQICRTAAIHDGGWGARECVGKRPAFVFGGTMRNDVGLEAVKFTV